MSRKTVTFLLFIMANSWVTTAQTKLVIRDLQGLEWEYDKRYSLLDSSDYFASSFSVADVSDPTDSRQKLNKCTCRLKRDTVDIWIHNTLSEGGIAISISLTEEFGKAYIQHYSDIEELESGYYKNYQPKQSTLYVNLPNYKIGDMLRGSIDITAENIETLGVSELTMKGKFQCVVLEEKRR